MVYGIDLGADVLALVTTLIAAVGGGISWVWTKLEARRKEMEGRFDRELSECHGQRRALELRVANLEASLHTSAPSWRRTQDGTILWCNSEFVRLFGAPNGYRMSDMTGRSFASLDRFSKELIAELAEMDREVLSRGYASKSGVRVTSDVTATVIKVSATSGGDVVYVGYAVPEDRKK